MQYLLHLRLLSFPECVYQLLEDCGKVMHVRWPEGRWLLAPLTTRFGSSRPEAIGLLHGICDLFYPTDRTALESPTDRDRTAVRS